MLATQNQWYVQVSGQSYGPYSINQMQNFIEEGRVISSSLVSQDMVQGFAMAAAFPAFAPMLAPKPTASPYLQPQVNPIIESEEPAPSIHRAQVTVFLVMAEIRSANAMHFLQALQAYGTAQRIGDTVWLLRSDIPLEAIHGALSATLDKTDRLFVLDSFANKTAWSNIGADMDKRIRDMWNV